MADYVAYYRVSTNRQGQSGLGLEAQEASVNRFIKQTPNSKLLDSFTDVKSGKRNDRTELMNALKRCRLTGAKLLIAKLDRLSRNAKFLLELQESEVEFIALDMPEANKFTIGIMSCLAEYESQLISERVKASYESRRARGLSNTFGNPKLATIRNTDIVKANEIRIKKANQRKQEVKQVLNEFMEQYENKLSLRAMADLLNEAGYTTPRGKSWSHVGVKRVLAA